MPTLYIAIYRARHGNYKHWALYLDDGNDSTIFQVNGQHPTFQKSSTKSTPTRSSSHLTNILVASVRKADVPEVGNAFEDTNVDNDTVEWTCQDFVLEILDKLREDEVIDEDDGDYNIGREEAMEYFGPS